MGLVLNRPLGRKLGELLTGHELPEPLAAMPLFYGGPVGTDRLVLALFIEGKAKGSITCSLGLPIEQIEAHVEAERGWVRAFAGYSGWGEGQLERELKEKAWKICKPDETLFADHLVPGLWPFFLGRDQRWRKLIPVLPKDSSLN